MYFLRLPVTVTLAFSLISFVAISQKWSLGLAAAPVKSKVKTNATWPGLYPRSYESALGIYAALNLTRSLGRNFGLRTGLEYSQNAVSHKIDFGSRNLNQTDNFYYASLPLLFEAKKGGHIKAILQTGASIAYLIKATTVSDNSRSILTPGEGYEETEPLNVFLHGGAGLQVPMSEHFSIEFLARGNWGLRNVDKTFKETHVQSYFISFGVQYHYKIKK